MFNFEFYILGNFDLLSRSSVSGYGDLTFYHMEVNVNSIYMLVYLLLCQTALTVLLKCVKLKGIRVKIVF